MIKNSESYVLILLILSNAQIEDILIHFFKEIPVILRGSQNRTGRNREWRKDRERRNNRKGAQGLLSESEIAPCHRKSTYSIIVLESTKRLFTSCRVHVAGDFITGRSSLRRETSFDNDRLSTDCYRVTSLNCVYKGLESERWKLSAHYTCNVLMHSIIYYLIVTSYLYFNRTVFNFQFLYFICLSYVAGAFHSTWAWFLNRASLGSKIPFPLVKYFDIKAATYLPSFLPSMFAIYPSLLPSNEATASYLSRWKM